LFGGYVSWEQGTETDGSDSLALEVAPASHWPQMKAAILVVSAAKKGVSSTSGMQATVATSELFSHRANVVVPQRMEKMKQAIRERDFETFADLTMKDSNQFHAVCLDTQPPIFYLNDVSRAAIRAVDEINKKAGKKIAAYTFDAGPNAVIYYLEENEQAVLGALNGGLEGVEGWKNVAASADVSIAEAFLQPLKEGITRVILTRVGEGPVRVEESLVDSQGQPIRK
jgi:diphosphomevalonate decarboxylase